jgi:hypothetical protein
MLSAFAALLAAVPLAAAAAGDGCCRHARRGHFYYAPPAGYAVSPSPYADWRAYYEDQAALSFARRNARANYYVATGRTAPSRYFGPPTNYYAEHYALDPYAYFNCPLARRGEGVCSDPDFFKQ